MDLAETTSDQRHETESHLPPSIYFPLGVNEIRVLRAVEGSSYPEWRCENLELDKGHAFYAVSYTWGEDFRFQQQSISLSGRDLSVGKNAYDVLEFLQSNNEVNRTIPIWLDAVCIDQTNHLEKLHQIPLMKKVYSQASIVWIFLGKASGPQAGPVARGTLSVLDHPISSLRL